MVKFWITKRGEATDLQWYCTSGYNVLLECSDNQKPKGHWHIFNIYFHFWYNIDFAGMTIGQYQYWSDTISAWLIHITFITYFVMLEKVWSSRDVITYPTFVQPNHGRKLSQDNQDIIVRMCTLPQHCWGPITSWSNRLTTIFTSIFDLVSKLTDVSSRCLSL